MTHDAILLRRPRILQYFGLPYSGRIAHLAEDKIRELRGRGRSAADEPERRLDGWPQTVARLSSLTPEHQEAFVLCCVAGMTTPELARSCGATKPKRFGSSRRLLPRSRRPRGRF